MSVGSSLSGFIVGYDASGNTVTYANTALRVVVAASAGIGSSAAGDVRLDAATTQLPDVALLVEEQRENEPLPTVAYVVEVVRAPGSSGLPVASLSGRVALTTCAVGYGKETTLLAGHGATLYTLCRECPASSHSDVVGFVPCVPIKECGINSVDVSSALDAVPECMCDTGFMLVGINPEASYVVECAPCPSGAVCKRGRDPPLAAPGYYGESNSSFVQCRRASGCPGGAARSCAKGYVGYMCNVCDVGYYSNANQECVVCPPESQGALAGGMAILAAIGAGAGVVVVLSVAKARKGMAGGGSLRKRTMPASLSMILVAFQVVGILGDIDLSWSGQARGALRSFNIANVDVNLFASECSLTSFHYKYAVSVSLPLVVFLGAVAIATTLRFSAMRAKLSGVTMGVLVDAAVFSIAPLVYIPMARATFVLFDCTRLPNGDWVLDADPGVGCFDEAWWSVFPVGIGGLATYVIGVPAYSMLALMRSQHQLLEPATFARYGELYKLYRVPFYWGGVADLGKRLAIVCTAVFVSDRQIPQIGVLLTILLSASWAVLSFKPYYYPLYNRLDFQLTVVLVVILLLGAASHADPEAADTLFVPVVLMLVILCFIGARALFTDLLQIVRSRRNRYSPAHDRARRLARQLEREVPDMAPELGEAVAAVAVRLGEGEGEWSSDGGMALTTVALGSSNSSEAGPGSALVDVSLSVSSDSSSGLESRRSSRRSALSSSSSRSSSWKASNPSSAHSSSRRTHPSLPLVGVVQAKPLSSRQPSRRNRPSLSGRRRSSAVWPQSGGRQGRDEP
ncbi:uncharacterized protein AMSG_00437 [Thecamonas trahens ATCC 50062]|uniref:Tyrosine-protein kinase ephrin type A/B receptor-like domain-containing protein n=1 Tax=Thecamonas trahens ATCC 50062 TaxID=461836 RepID=A0A0L0D8J4_THETB|nr:hypothetical protein AMSG_00437 [Thecamonas trahens ATCC 50062]KNC48659.1 hypothetical protein AMSG_00437 [Thecamonas trahens ATCC 50062]|eukprot:XP_013762715.1 hypothetical protein AMSG_00437 [Thecamonas trahens ATCC 50062]